MKESTQNEYNKSLNKAIDYINTHLKEQIDLVTLSKVANISEYHFHRIFKAFIGESVGAYITRLRLEYAAQLLQTTTSTLNEIAERTGYQTQYAISKAFKKHFGISPSAFRNIQQLFAYNFVKEKKEYPTLTPEIKFIKEKELVYIRIIAKYGSDKEYSEAWGKLWKYAKQNDILDWNNEFIGLSFDDPKITNSDRCRFYACISTNKPVKPEKEFGTIKIKEGKYAVFTLKGSYSTLDDMYNAIYYQWLPESGYNLRNGMSFEKYLNGSGKVKESELLTEIYMPISK